MKKKYILLLFLALTVMVSCIHDDTTGYVRKISEITISGIRGEAFAEGENVAYVNLLVPTKMEAEVEQSMEGYELFYEWKTGKITSTETDGTVIYDSLSIISEEKVLEHAFEHVGEYLLRLRVYNEFGSSFYYARVQVRAGMEEGLLILSENENRGRISFVATKGADELLNLSSEDVDTDVWSRLNYDYDLQTPRDVLAVEDGNVYLISETQQCLYELDNSTLEVLRKMDLTLMTPEIKPLAMARHGNGSNLRVLSADGTCVLCQIEYDGLTKDDLGNDTKYEKMISFKYEYIPGWGIYNNTSFLIDNENEVITMIGGNRSGNELTNQRIINCNMSKNNQLYVVSVANDNPQRVKVTRYGVFSSFVGSFSSPVSYEYDLFSSSLTLTQETDLLLNGLYNVFYYYQDNKIYRWRYSQPNSSLPTADDTKNACTIPSGEVTCMTQSLEGKYLYVGVWDESASSVLKGSVYVYNADTWEIENQFTGIADKPVKIIYKQY